MTNTLKELSLARINRLVNDLASNSESWRVGNIYIGIINLAATLYGKDSPVLLAIRTIWDQMMARPMRNEYEHRDIYKLLLEHFRGILHTMKNDVESGLIGSLEARLQGEIFADFVTSAKAALDEGQKDVAAVLACAAFEDAIKRYADHVGVIPSEEGLQPTINQLKSKGVIGGAQKGIVDSFVRVRNAAMHANWEKIHPEDVRGVIGFVEQFLLTRFESIS
jgi:hypothetical protein